MTHEPRLTRELRNLIHAHRVAALGTAAADGSPFVSMVPFAVLPSTHDTQGALVIHVSALAAHTQQMQVQPKVSLMVMQAEVSGHPVHALQRVTFNCVAASPTADSTPGAAARSAYLRRFPEAEPMTQLGDFRFVLLTPASARHVAGFGAARPVDADELRDVLSAVGKGA